MTRWLQLISLLVAASALAHAPEPKFVLPNQALAASYRYDPYGNTIGLGGSLAAANVYRFSSKEVHAVSGLYYYGERFYEPNLQRWLNRDPLGEEGGLNLYGFVGNDAVNAIDPLGLIFGDKSSSFWVAYFGRVYDPRAHWENLTGGDTFRTASAYSYHVLKSPWEMAKLAHELNRAQWHPLEAAARLQRMLESVPCQWRQFWRSSAENQMEGLGGFAGDLAGGWATGAGAANGLKTLSATQAAKTPSSLLPVRYDPVFALEQGANPATAVPNIYSVVRGGQGAMPPPGTVFSGSMGSTVAEAAAGVPHGTIRATTAGAIRGQGGTVTLAPELTRGGSLNPIHVNVMEGAQPTVFGPQIPNPVPRAGRIP